jgi:hypothetical protein
MVTISVSDPGCFIPDPDPYIYHPGSRILWVKKYRIPDPTVHKEG